MSCVKIQKVQVKNSDVIIHNALDCSLPLMLSSRQIDDESDKQPAECHFEGRGPEAIS